MDYLILLSSIALDAGSVFQLKLDQPQYLKPSTPSPAPSSSA